MAVALQLCACASRSQGDGDSPANGSSVNKWCVSGMAWCVRPAPPAMEQPPDWPLLGVNGETSLPDVVKPMMPICKAAAFL